MPKETVHDQAGMYDITVGWQRGNNVQVGVVTANGLTIAEQLTPEGTEPAQFRGLWGNLDRDGCNKLIRDLRRARDAAYGADA